MSATAERPRILKLYDEWRSLSHAEGNAIRENAWVQVEKCQSAKYALQPLIQNAQQEWREERGPEGPTEAEVRSIIAELIHLEHENDKTLAEVREAAIQERDALTQSTRNIAQIRQSYSIRSDVGWSSYG